MPAGGKALNERVPLVPDVAEVLEPRSESSLQRNADLIQSVHCETCLFRHLVHSTPLDTLEHRT